MLKGAAEAAGIPDSRKTWQLGTPSTQPPPPHSPLCAGPFQLTLSTSLTTGHAVSRCPPPVCIPTSVKPPCGTCSGTLLAVLPSAAAAASAASCSSACSGPHHGRRLLVALPAVHLGAGVALALCHLGHHRGQLGLEGGHLGSRQLAAVHELPAFACGHMLDATPAGAAGEEEHEHD